MISKELANHLAQAYVYVTQKSLINVLIHDDADERISRFNYIAGKI